MKKLLLINLLTYMVVPLLGQKEIPNLTQVDILHYDFQIAISDTSNEIHGITQVDIQFLKNQKEFAVDFVKKRADGKGMEVLAVKANDIWKCKFLPEQAVLDPDTWLLFTTKIKQ